MNSVSHLRSMFFITVAILVASSAACGDGDSTTDSGTRDTGSLDTSSLDSGSVDGATDPGLVDTVAPDTDGSDAGDGPIALSDLQEWTRVEGRVFRDMLGGYEVAADPHVFRDDDGSHMIYSGDVDETQSIKLASSATGWLEGWAAVGPVISGPATGLDTQRETPFYRRADDGRHQIYYIGYENEETYLSQIYLAESDDLAGPYDIPEEPIVTLGTIDGRDVRLITSPAVVEHEGQLYMVFMGWDMPGEAVTATWIFGGTSTDDGRSWQDLREVDVPVGTEGQLTRGPDGKFYATRTGELEDSVDDRREALYLARADEPFGPYEALAEPVLIQEGPPLEGGLDTEGMELFSLGEANAAHITFDHAERTAYLFYHGANYATGYWVRAATTTY